MKKYIPLILFTLISVCSFGQSWTTIANYQKPLGVWVTAIFRLPSDTVSNKTGVASISGVIYSGNGTYWQQVGKDYFSGFGTTLSGTTFGVDSLVFTSWASRKKLGDSIVSLLGSYVPTSRTLTINSTALDFSTNRSWNVGLQSATDVDTVSTHVLKFKGLVITGTTNHSGFGFGDNAVRLLDTLAVDVDSHGIMDLRVIRGSATHSNGYASFDVAASLTDANGYNYDHVSAFQSRPTINTTGTMSAVYGGWSSPDINRVTLTDVYGWYNAGYSSFIASATVTNETGFYAAGTSRATNNYGFVGAMTAGANRWNLYMSGTAINYLNGPLTIGTNNSNARKLNVNGTVGINKDSVTLITSAGSNDILVLDTTTNQVKRISASSIGGGVTTMAAIGSSANANGASISGSTLTLQPASASFGGVVTTGTQTFGGAKTIASTASGVLTLDGSNVNGVYQTWQNGGTLYGFIGTGLVTGALGEYSIRSQSNLVFSSNGSTERWRINTTGTLVGNGTGITLGSMADGSAPNSTLYYSTTQSKLVWKDSGGTVNVLY
jgi:hypothetical protein